ncbi:Flp1 family type IVb pilin [Paenibacillus yanchengensis]|uniref:Flp1 family type IVb pilin n=1 Tax=Paenibacillus yanchengensis TaxID=2035833 RepID=A0ABW4YFM8_9BACL
MKLWIARSSRKWNEFMMEEDAIGTIEIILIIAVIILIALLFKDWIMALLRRLMNKADDKANSIFN